MLQLYEDAVEMQMYFIKTRDETCRNGEILLTPALSYMERHLQVALDAEKMEKLPLEQQNMEDKRSKQEAEEYKTVCCIRVHTFDHWWLGTLHYYSETTYRYHLLKKKKITDCESSHMPLINTLGEKGNFYAGAKITLVECFPIYNILTTST